MEDFILETKKILLMLKLFLIPLPGKGLSKKEKLGISSYMEFRFQIEFLSLHLGDDEDSSWGISVLTVHSMNSNGSLLRLTWSKYGYLILGFLFFPLVRIRITKL